MIGGGPAGVAAALTLARQGTHVGLLDRATFPRDKFCGDGLTTAALRLYERFGLRPAAVASWTSVDRFALRSPSGRWIDLPLPGGAGLYGAVARRAELDAAFLGLARQDGVEILEGHGLEDAKQDADGITVTTTGPDVRAGWLIGADGMWSPSRKALGADVAGYRGDWHAFRQYFTGVGPRARRELTVWFEPDLLPGYVWSFPVGDGGANVGFGILRDGRYRVGDMKELWPDLLSRPQVREVLGDATPEGPHRAWPIPARIGRVPLSRGRALWVGDAAAAVDRLTGEGIAQALDTGTWAAEALLAHREHGAEVVALDYERRVRSGLAADDRMSQRLSRAMSHRKGARVALWLVDRNDWTRRNFARWLWEDYPRAAALTPKRWRRGLFAGPGAYRDAAPSSA